LLASEVLAKPIEQSKKESPRLYAGISTFTFPFYVKKFARFSDAGNF